MANGNMLTIFREMAEKKTINPETSLPFVFQGLVDIIDMIDQLNRDNAAYRVKREAEDKEYREKKLKEEKDYREKNEAKHRACDDRLQALENKKDIIVAAVGAGGVIIGALLTTLFN